MKLLVTGATGVLGRPTVAALVAGGHDVSAVARDETKAEHLRDAGAEPVQVDLFDADAVHAAVAGKDAILHLATNVPTLRKAGFLPSWRMHNRLRTEATANLLAGARDHGVTRFVKESVTFVYPDRGAEWIDESVPVDADVNALRPTLDGEHMVEAFGREGGTGVVLRFGLFYGPEARSVDEALRLARSRLAPISGRPDAYLSSIHVDDAAQAVVAALTLDGGIYNVVDDEPLARREYVDAFSAAFGLPKLHLVPGKVVRTVGGTAAKALISSQRVANGTLRTAAAWAPEYPSAREGWAAIGVARNRAHKGVQGGQH
jgi:nucleoside-diphosphate-sugar epimerase